ncbi:glutamine amidotransferase [Acidiphilium sp.]|uniref:glutamine amidotransferase n=1 Tax=Acidiphilium sp. TaxID=527 RepID=UPI002CE158C3|nr:glutamine amidotransferase [Acidiphilium sp.]HQT62833.1 glutamine amidotransferase [Acidiphilium sp.]
MEIESPSPDSKRVLIVLHQEHSTPGRVGRLLETLGYSLDARRPRFGDPLPETLRDHAGAIIFGGPMSANDGDDYVRREIDWINVALKEDKPFLGICLGAQMLARCLGHRVSPHPEGRVEIGYYPIAATEHGEKICAARFPDHVYHWHREGFECPRGATLLAEGADFETQAIKVGRAAYGFQFHPEVTYAMMCRWTCRGAERMGLPGARERREHLDGWFLHDQKVARWTSDFLACWLKAGETGGCAG